MKGDESVQACARHSNETLTLRKPVAKYKTVQKWMLEFLRKYENGVELTRKLLELTLNSHHQIYQFAFTLYGVEARCDDIFKLTARTQSIY